MESFFPYNFIFARLTEKTKNFTVLFEYLLHVYLIKMWVLAILSHNRSSYYCIISLWHECETFSYMLVNFYQNKILLYWNKKGSSKFHIDSYHIFLLNHFIVVKSTKLNSIKPHHSEKKNKILSKNIIFIRFSLPLVLFSMHDRSPWWHYNNCYDVKNIKALTRCNMRLWKRRNKIFTFLHINILLSCSWILLYVLSASNMTTYVGMVQAIIVGGEKYFPYFLFVCVNILHLLQSICYKFLFP